MAFPYNPPYEFLPALPGFTLTSTDFATVSRGRTLRSAASWAPVVRMSRRN